jgi:hypothetical protein
LTEDPAEPVGWVDRFERLVSAHPEVHEERYWPAYVAVAVGIWLQVRLPGSLDVGSHWLLPILESVLLVGLIGGRYVSPTRHQPSTMWLLRVMTIAVIAVVSGDNIMSLVLLARQLLLGSSVSGRDLILAAMAIWITNVIIFGLWYWELDGGGPVRRRAEPQGRRDFLYPQMTMPPNEPHGAGSAARYRDWMPGFFDYLYVSFTNATAFSPTDAMPLSQWAKALMLVQSATSLVTVLLVAARAVNVLQSP